MFSKHGLTMGCAAHSKSVAGRVQYLLRQLTLLKFEDIYLERSPLIQSGDSVSAAQNTPATQVMRTCHLKHVSWADEKFESCEWEELKRTLQDEAAAYTSS